VELEGGGLEAAAQPVLETWKYEYEALVARREKVD